MLVVVALAINVMGDLVNQNFVEVEVTQIITGVPRAEIERMSEEKNTRPPINTVAADATAL